MQTACVTYLVCCKHFSLYRILLRLLLVCLQQSNDLTVSVTVSNGIGSGQSTVPFQGEFDCVHSSLQIIIVIYSSSPYLFIGDPDSYCNGVQCYCARFSAEWFSKLYQFSCDLRKHAYL